MQIIKSPIIFKPNKVKLSIRAKFWYKILGKIKNVDYER